MGHCKESSLDVVHIGFGAQCYQPWKLNDDTKMLGINIVAIGDLSSAKDLTKLYYISKSKILPYQVNFGRLS